MTQSQKNSKQRWPTYLNARPRLASLVAMAMGCTAGLVSEVVHGSLLEFFRITISSTRVPPELYASAIGAIVWFFGFHVLRYALAVNIIVLNEIKRLFDNRNKNKAMIVANEEKLESAFIPIMTKETGGVEVPVYYATNRSRTPGYAMFSDQISDECSYGTATVRIPVPHHTTGRLERPLFWQPENPKRHVTVTGWGPTLSEAAWIEKLKSAGQDHALIFVHGIQTTFVDSVCQLGQLTFDLGYKGIPVVFSWPTKAAWILPSLSSFMGSSDTSQASANALQRLIENLRVANVRKIDVLAYSMGNRLALGALESAALTSNSRIVGELICARPEMQNNLLAQKAALARKVCNGMTLYVSESDNAIRVASILTRLEKGGVRRGMDPLILPEIDTIDLTEEKDGFDLVRHKISTIIATDIMHLLRGVRPPHDRTLHVRGVPEGATNPRYWKVRK